MAEEQQKPCENCGQPATEGAYCATCAAAVRAYAKKVEEEARKRRQGNGR